VTKARIVDAVREARGEEQARRIEALKKDDMAAQADGDLESRTGRDGRATRVAIVSLPAERYRHRRPSRRGHRACPKRVVTRGGHGRPGAYGERRKATSQMVAQAIREAAKRFRGILRNLDNAIQLQPTSEARLNS